MANAEKRKELSFSITARTALLLGRENISSPTVAVLELVRNAYDADAKNVTIRFRKASTSDGTIEIIDDGHGMCWDDIVNKWMMIGTNNKQISPYSPSGRRKVGEKGIGRFALDRLAIDTIMETTSAFEESEPTYRLQVTWSKFENTDKALNEIKHPIEPIDRHKKTGTKLLLKGLRDSWTRKDYDNLYRDLVVLVPPFERKLVGFKIRFDCDEAPELSGMIENKLTEAAIYKMQSTLSKNGKVNIKITSREDSPNNTFRLINEYDRSWEELFDSPEKPSCGALYFEFYWYLRDSASIKPLGISLKQLTDYLDVYGGVRIYRDGFRVKSYGEPGGYGDWLGLNARRVKHPGGVKSSDWVVAENQVAAGVFISKETNPDLIDQTNREGLITNQAFNDLRSFALKSIELFESDRQLYERQKRKDETSVTVDQSIDNAKVKLDKEFNKLEDAIRLQSDGPQKEFLVDALEQMRETQNASIQQVEALYQEEQQSTISKMQLLQNAATVGIAVAAFGHEVLRSGHHVLDSIQRLNKRFKQLMLISDEKIAEYLSRLNRHGTILYSVASFALGHIDRDKRTRQKFNAAVCIEKLIDENLREMCATNSAQIYFIKGSVPDIYAFPYEIESIVSNFVTNSIAAFQRGKILLAERQIEIETQFDEKQGLIKIIGRDNGPGIPEGDKERIFDIYSTKVDEEGKPYGTGLGLVIIKDIVESYNGSIIVHEHSTKENMKGAEFIVSLPALKERGPKKGYEDEQK